MFTSIIRISLFFVLLLPLGSQAQNTAVLDAYVREALEANTGLQQQQLQLEKALYALKEARSLFGPSVSLNATYTRAAGGRSIDLPVGDMLNPVYSTLNQLTASGRFPQIENESVLFNPDNFYDAKLHTTLPLINLEIGYNKRIKNKLIDQQQAAINIYKRALIKDVKTAYYQYYQLRSALDIYKSSLQLVLEHVRVNESLYRNGVRNATALTRSQAEQAKVEAAIKQQEYACTNAAAYFNFLLNRDLNAEIKLDDLEPAQMLDGDAVQKPAYQREELSQLNHLMSISDLSVRMLKSNQLPRLNAFLDLGSQAFNFHVNSKSMYYIGGLSLQWDLFAGGRNKHRMLQAQAEQRTIASKYTEAERALSLQEEQSRNNLLAAREQLKSARVQVALAQRYFNDQLKAYKEGSLLYIELADAETQLTTARLSASVAEASVGIALAELERNTAAYEL